MTDEKTNALIYRPGSGLSKPGRGSNPILRRITQDVLTRTQDNRLSGARFRVGGYLLREPDYRQLLIWVDSSSMTFEEVWDGIGSFLNHAHMNGGGIGWEVEDGAIVSMTWNFNYTPFIPLKWEQGLLIRTLAFYGKWPDTNIILRPVLTRLKTLVCQCIGLSTIDLSQIQSLANLYCDGNLITKLNLSTVRGLIELSCESNQIVDLDLTPVFMLTILKCSENFLTTLDLHPVPNLTELYCNGNKLTKLDLSPVSALSVLSCNSNQLIFLDLTPVPKLTDLFCWANHLTKLNLEPVPMLTALFCADNNLTQLNLASVPELTYLHCEHNSLTKLDLSMVPKLISLVCDEGVQILNAPAALDVYRK